MDKYSLIKKVTEIEGLTDEERSTLLGLIRTKKKYGLVWEDKPEDVEERLRDELPVLSEVKERAIISDDKDAPNHILIEGDNLEALTTLSYTHAGKIDVIYIDPPYNTGQKEGGFIFNDKLVDKEDIYKHSKWLSFMYKRLLIAKKLLSENGIIFISIDDNEQSQLKILCDEIFSLQNFVGTYFWKRTSTPPALSYKIRKKLEFILCYQKKDVSKRRFAQGYIDGGDVPLLNSSNPIGTLTFPAGVVRFGIDDGVYSAKSSYKIELLNAVVVENGTNVNSFRASGHFKWGQSNLDSEIDNGTYFLIKSNLFSPRFQKSEKSTKVPSNIIDDEVGVGTNEDANKELDSLGLSFDYAKPSSLITYLIKMPFWQEKKITILDFFAGSGTTLHATMQLNAEDGGRRQCILVTNNENNICEEVTYERNKRVIQGYTTPKGETVEGLKANNLRYYKTTFVSRDRTPNTMRQLVNLSTDMLCIKENIYNELSVFGNLKVLKSIFRYFEEGDKRMLVIYREEVIDRLVEEIYNMELLSPLKVYLFSPSEDPWEGQFEDVADKVDLCALPQAIYNAYQRILPIRRDIII